jgi:hypothetical protein
MVRKSFVFGAFLVAALAGLPVFSGCDGDKGAVIDESVNSEEGKAEWEKMQPGGKKAGG